MMSTVSTLRSLIVLAEKKHAACCTYRYWDIIVVKDERGINAGHFVLLGHLGYDECVEGKDQVREESG